MALFQEDFWRRGELNICTGFTNMNKNLSKFMWQENAFGDILMGFFSFTLHCLFYPIFWEPSHQSWNDENKRLLEANLDFKFKNPWFKMENIWTDVLFSLD